MKTPKIVAYTLAVVGVVLILLSLVHLAALPLVLEANKAGGLNLPSIENVGLGFHLVRKPVLWGLLVVGVDRCLIGAILLLCVPDLTKGRKTAWRICLAIGLFVFVGYTALTWLLFERVHLAPLVMPGIGLLVFVLLLLGRHSFTVE